ncbi:CLUMA_CG006855, isoform A [Clunio marinus]|uniref:CLUMA_CG006855, isoform A n=1 Tax=Clunio marinus TaxID=568069 RepID=A0A1J1I0L2_9DIPT|nr:CLUMA_CG006855, isoform A [Clunio marinus]
MSPNQITFSSIKDAGSVKTKVRKNPLEIIKLSSTRGWMPLTVSMTEYVLFDFIENRKLTGIVTKGGEYGWVKSFNVLYSQDNIIWNKIEDDSGDAFEFLANVDAYKIKKNFFKSPVNARYMKIQPTKWHSTIELKIEPIGCFVPYPVIAQAATTKPEVEIVTPSTCGVCKGILAPRPVRPSACTCYPPLYWSGSECVPQSQCPCVEGHMIYEIGETYQTEDCADCICKIGGVPDCKPKVCAPCGQGLRRESPKSCSCQCVPCPPDTILCQTSGECIPESSWCDGVQDCPDDEKNCIITEKPMIFVNRTETLSYMIRLQIQKDSKECAKFSCEAAAVNDAVCNVTGRTFNTFDFTEFKYDICNHLLARDAADEKWNVIMKKNCSSGNNICRKEIVIKDKVSMYTLTLYPSLTVNLDGYPFFICNIKDDEIFISSMMPTCSDVSNCPPLMRYTDGCCEKCKLESLSQQNCLPESLAEKVTLGLIKTQIPPHGKCQNFEPIRGVTQCSGTCKSGTIFDPITFHQLKSCDCCSVSSVKEIAVELVCEDKYKLIKHFNVPSSCACSKCGADDIKSL